MDKNWHPKFIYLIGREDIKMKNKKHSKKKISSKDKDVSYVVIVAIIAILFCTGFIIKSVVSPNRIPFKSTKVDQTPSKMDPYIERQISLISANFRCACGGCGEMQLIECDCKMPRGAQEEKEFMRQKLEEGFSVEHIIQLVDEKYGYRNI